MSYLSCYMTFICHGCHIPYHGIAFLGIFEFYRWYFSKFLDFGSHEAHWSSYQGVLTKFIRARTLKKFNFSNFGRFWGGFGYVLNIFFYFEFKKIYLDMTS